MSGSARTPGWDTQAVNGIAADQYGGLEAMFEEHGWEKGDRTFSQIAPSRVKDTYGSVEAFVRAHENGRDGNAMLDPMAAIRSAPPQVFLKSLYGFTPESWGFLGYTKATTRDWFLRESRPGALVVIAGTANANDPRESLRVLGMQQQTHIVGTKWDFLAPERHAAERLDPDRSRRWYHALKATRAWRIPDEDRPYVRDIFPETHNDGKNGTAIGSMGMRLQPSEAQALLGLNLFEVSVFGGNPVDALMPGSATELLKPSRPGPVSQTGFLVREAEGPKHLYVLRLEGEEERLLGYDPAGRWIVKVGFSVAPSVRCRAHNQALPACAFGWKILLSTHEEGRKAFPSSKHALAGEGVMKGMLEREGRSLGGEFFLADESVIIRAWRAGVEAAQAYEKA